MLLNDYWLLTFKDGDFCLVEQPSLQKAQLIQSYHQILLSLTRSQYENLGAIASLDFYLPGLEVYYQKIADLLSPLFDSSKLTPESRQLFYIAFEPRGTKWISGLEILLGLDFDTTPKTESTPELQITSGNLEIDIVAELLLYIESGRVEWLVQNKSPQYLIKLIKQLGDRRRGQEAVDDLQRQKDLEKSVNLEESLKTSGFPGF
jgi:hypothetical protein